MYRLYYSPGACSLAVHALLHSLEAPFDIILTDIAKGDNRSPEFLKLNPRGQVPVLLDGPAVLRESAQLAFYLADKHKSPLLPGESLARAHAMEWLGFYNSSLQQAYGAYFLMSKRLQDEAQKNAACDLAARRIGFLWREVEAHLAASRYLCGDAPTLADLFHAVIANWTTTLSHDVTLGPSILRLCNDVSVLPYFQKALAAENLTFNITGK